VPAPDAVAAAGGRVPGKVKAKAVHRACQVAVGTATDFEPLTGWLRVSAVLGDVPSGSSVAMRRIRAAELASSGSGRTANHKNPASRVVMHSCSRHFSPAEGMNGASHERSRLSF
jgi:hypothetical protein